MKKFRYIVEQAGEGCDYTIGCGIAHGVIKSESKESALLLIIEKYTNSECDIDKVIITEESNVSHFSEKEIQCAADEYEQYLNLREKFEKHGDN